MYLFWIVSNASQYGIGALQQKAEQIAKLKQDIAELQDKQVEYAKETADYDNLKVAFSQSGVPHQIQILRESGFHSWIMSNCHNLNIFVSVLDSF